MPRCPTPSDGSRDDADESERTVEARAVDLAIYRPNSPYAYSLRLVERTYRQLPLR